MIFTQPIFLLFFLGTFLVYWRLRGHLARKRWLFFASYFFYGYWNWRFLGLILLCTTVDYFTARALDSEKDEKHRKSLITLSIVTNLSVLGFFKYFNFFVDSAYATLHQLGYQAEPPSLRVLLPVGISFFTFQSMSYTVDVYRRGIHARKSFLDFALFVSFFPQLVAGPIVRARDFLPQVERPQLFSDVNVRRALVLFAVGYFKKACVADNVSAAIDRMYADPSLFDAGSRVLGAAMYSLQIFCDFSGYTDMAIAVAALFGFTLVKNFDAPYFSANIQDFWQRWHISLSTWLRDYLYIPLGGNRGTAWLVARNLFLTMVIGGLWHGANWTFVLWGALHGLALVSHRFFARRFPPLKGLAPRVLGWALTLSWVVFCFTIFRTPSISEAWLFFTAGSKSATLGVSAWWWAIIIGLGALQYSVRCHAAWLEQKLHGFSDWTFYGALGLASAGLLYMTPLNMSPFIYFQF